MISAWFNAIFGTALVFAIALFKLGLGEADALWCVAASNIAGMTSLLLYSFGGRQPWVRRHLLHGPVRTWALFLTAYFGLLLALTPQLRASVNFLWLIVPVILTTGFCVLAYGPLQDRLVARSQRRTVGGP